MPLVLFEIFRFKVGAPPEIAALLDEIRRENDVYNKHDAASTCIGADPELDEFMVTRMFVFSIKIVEFFSFSAQLCCCGIVLNNQLFLTRDLKTYTMCN